MTIYLTGFMGCGKSSTGRRVARVLGYTFADTDCLVEETAGKSIARIFAEEGETVFRQLETEALAAPPVGIGFAVRHARRFRVIGEIVIAVALQSQRLEARQRARKGGRAVLHTALRRVRPALKAVDEKCARPAPYPRASRRSRF